MNNLDLDKLLKFDPIATAEGIYGRNTESTRELGLAAHMEHSELKRSMLTALDDTIYGDTTKRFMEIVRDLGFEDAFYVPFQGQTYGDQKPSNDSLYVMAHRDGMLLVFDTYCTHSVHSAKVYYNWKNSSGGQAVTSSGSWHCYDHATGVGVWAGAHDAREALRHKIQLLRDSGEFLPRWERVPFLWLLHYMDVKQPHYDYCKINAERMARMPPWVLRMITPA